jgi:hypothetical protein
VGAILAFAVTTNTPVINVHIVGWVLILTGLVGVFVPRRGYGWLRRRMVVRQRTEEAAAGPADEAGYPRSVVTRTLPGEGPVAANGWRSGLRRRSRHQTLVEGPDAVPAGTETIEEFTEE